MSDLTPEEHVLQLEADRNRLTAQVQALEIIEKAALGKIVELTKERDAYKFAGEQAVGMGTGQAILDERDRLKMQVRKLEEEGLDLYAAARTLAEERDAFQASDTNLRKLLIAKIDEAHVLVQERNPLEQSLAQVRNWIYILLTALNVSYPEDGVDVVKQLKQERDALRVSINILRQADSQSAWHTDSTEQMQGLPFQDSLSKEM